MKPANRSERVAVSREKPNGSARPEGEKQHQSSVLARENEKMHADQGGEEEAPVWQSKGGGLYVHAPSGVYYERPWVERNGTRIRTYRSLKTCNQRQAQELLNQRRGRSIDARLGKTEDPYAKRDKRQVELITEVLKLYAEAGYPDRFMAPRNNPKTLEGEQRNIEALEGFFASRAVTELSQALCDSYHKWRCEKVTRGNGNRTVELELNTLSNALNWAARKELIEANPISKRARYRQAKDIRHCRDFMPQDAEELHKIVRFMFEKKKSQVLGFQALLEAYTGLRTEEVLKLRSDAAPRQPGWISSDGTHLYVWCLKNQHQNNPYVAIRPGLRAALNALFRWKSKNYPASPWFFPSPYDQQKTVDPSSLVHRLNDYGSALAEMAAGEAKERQKRNGQNQKAVHKQEIRDLPETPRFTSHGLRAWYVTVRRSHDIPDAQIAYEIGHTSGGGTLAEVYGGIPPNWREEGGPKMAWLPQEPAWRMFWPEDINVIPALAAQPETVAGEEE